VYNLTKVEIIKNTVTGKYENTREVVYSNNFAGEKTNAFDKTIQLEVKPGEFYRVEAESERAITSASSIGYAITNNIWIEKAGKSNATNLGNVQYTGSGFELKTLPTGIMYLTGSGSEAFDANKLTATVAGGATLVKTYDAGVRTATLKATAEDGTVANVEILVLSDVPENTFAAEGMTLQPGTDATAMNFNWYSDSAAANNVSVVKIAKTSAPSVTTTVTGTAGGASAGKNWHKVSVTGLAPDTEYAYCVSNDGVAFSESYSFKTGAEGAFQFIAVGDPQLTTGNQDSDSVWPDPVRTTREGWIDTLAKINAIAPGAAFMAGTGDQVDTATSEDQYTNYFAPEQLRSLPVAPAVGNHEGTAPNFGWHFNIPNETEHGGKTDAYGNYWYTYNNALFVVLNTAPYPANAAEAAPYIAIMDATLKAATEANPDYKWLFVQHHKSTASPASHQTDSDVLVYAPLFNVLMDKYNVDIVLTGHDHVYSRSWAIRDNKKVDGDYSGNAITNPGGTIYFTLTTASGLKYYDFLQNAPAAPAWVNDTAGMRTERKSGPNNINGKPWYTNVGIQVKAPQFTTIDVTATNLTFKTYRTDTMALIDEYSVKKTNGADEANAKIHAASAVAANAPVEYAVSLSSLTKAQVITVTFVADGTYLDLNSAKAMNGFQMFGSPGAVNGIVWEQLAGGFWQGTVKLMSIDNKNGVTFSDNQNVLTITGTARGALGATTVKLVCVEITHVAQDNKAHKFAALCAEPSDWEAVTIVTARQPVYSKYDLNNDGRIDDEDFAIVWFYYLARSLDSNWEAILYDIASAKDADVSGDNIVDLADLIEILAHYCVSYNLYP
jgi:hypothetical protein